MCVLAVLDHICVKSVVVYCTSIQYFVQNGFCLQYWLWLTKHNTDRMQRCITKITNSFWTSSFTMPLVFTVSSSVLNHNPFSVVSHLHLWHSLIIQIFWLHSKLNKDLRHCVFVFIVSCLNLTDLTSEVHFSCRVQTSLLSLSLTVPIPRPLFPRCRMWKTEALQLRYRQTVKLQILYGLF